VDDSSVLTILTVVGLALGLGGSMAAVLARSERFESQRPLMEQIARQAGRGGLAILVIVAVIVAVFLLRELLGGSP